MISIKLPNGVYTYDPNHPLGRGGFGQVYLGEGTDGVQVAVKKLNVSAVPLAHRELRVAEEFRGKLFKHVVEFLDSGEDADSGEIFVVMPLAEYSLQARINSKGPCACSEAAEIMGQIAAGLAELEGLVHRDLKPDNVLWQGGAWKVADFGIAKFFEEVTSSNTLKQCGTPEYAAPEQFRGERATHATDIYALGCVGFCLLTGSPPFTTDCADQHQNGSLPPLNCEDNRLMALIRMMLRKPPDARPTASRVIELLQPIIQGPAAPSPQNALSLLVQVGAEIQALQEARDEKAAADRREQDKRDNLKQAALDILSENLEGLWRKLSSNVPGVDRAQQDREDPTKGYHFSLGDASLSVLWAKGRKAARKGSLPKCQWDLITHAQISVQREPVYVWQASLIYGKPPMNGDYRWFEVFFFVKEPRGLHGPFVQPQLEEMDRALAAGRVRGLFGGPPVQIAHGPTPIDDEAEDAFHERWMLLLFKAAKKELGYPRDLPFSWPPEMLK